MSNSQRDGIPVQGKQDGDFNQQWNFFAPVTYNFSGKFERLQDAYFDPTDLAGLLDLDRFTGREWLIELIDDFIREQRRGHVFILAEAGIGKSTLAAHLARERGWFHHFTRLQDGRSPAKARRNLAAQLIRRWGLLGEFAPGGMLPEAAEEPRWFSRLLREAAARRGADAAAAGAGKVPPIVLVVDGLDEAEPERSGTGGLPLGLPARLPDGVFVVATSRFGIEAAMNTAEDPEWAEIRVDGDDNLADMNRFLERILTPGGPAEDPVLAGELDRAGADRDRFRRALMRSCQGVWIYLYYVLDEIRRGKRSPKEVARLPAGLGPYYADQVERWRDGRGGEPSLTRWERTRGPLLGVLTAARAPLTGTELASFGRVEPREAAREFIEETARAFLSRVGDENWETAAYALRHQSLRDMLVGGATKHRGVQKTTGMTAPYIARAHENITSDLTPAGTAGTRDWTGTGPYARANLAAHAAACGMLDNLVCDPGFLLVTDPGALLARSASLRTRDSRRAIEAFKLSLNEKGTLADVECLSRLARNAARVHAASLVAACVERLGEEWPARWVTWAGQGHHKLVIEGGVYVIAVSRLEDRDVVIAQPRHGPIQIWDAVTGEFIREHNLIGDDCDSAIGRLWGRDVIIYYPREGSTISIHDALTGESLGEQALPISRITTLAFGQLEGRAIVVAGGWGGEVLIWDADSRMHICMHRGHRNPVSEVVIGPAENPSIVVTMDECRDCVLIWDAATGESLGRHSLDCPEESIAGFGVIRSEGRDLIIVGINNFHVENFEIRVLDFSGDHSMGTLISGKGILSEVAIIRSGIGDIITAECVTERLKGENLRQVWQEGRADWDEVFVRNLHTWDAATGRPVWSPLAVEGGGEGGGARAIAGGRTRGGDVVAVGFYGEVRIWNPAEDVRHCHAGEVSSVTFGVFNGQEAVISYSDRDMTVRAWGIRTGDSLAEPRFFDRGWGGSVIGRIGHDGVIVTQSRNILQIRDIFSGDPVGKVVTADINVESFTAGRIGGKGAIATTSENPGSGAVTVRIWDVDTGSLLAEPFGLESTVGCPIAIGRIGDDDVVLVGGTYEIAIWNASTKCIKRLPAFRKYGVTMDALAIGRLGDRDVIVSCRGKVVWIWDAVTMEFIDELHTNHGRSVTAVAIGRVGDQDLIVSGSDDRTVILHEHRSPVEPS